MYEKNHQSPAADILQLYKQPRLSQEIVLIHMYSASISHVTAAGVNPVGSSPSSI